MKYARGRAEVLSTHFLSTEFDCKCKYEECTTTEVDPLLIESLELLRKATGHLIITSGFRCEKHNKDVGGVGGSQHLIGRAADVKGRVGLNGNMLGAMAETVPAFKTGGVGINRKDWIHIDVRDSGPARWVYPLKG